MRILFLSNYRFTSDVGCGTGTWIEAMGRGLVRRGIQLANVTVGSSCCKCHADQSVEQWLIPAAWMFNAANPHREYFDRIDEICQSFRPDILHIWGHEVPWGVFSADRKLPFPALLEMQGVKSAMAKYMNGALTVGEQMKCVGIKEFLRPRISMWSTTRRYLAYRAVEDRIVAGHRYIDYQSDWILACLGDVKEKVLNKVRMSLKPDYLQCSTWKPTSGNHKIFTNCGVSPNKGLLVLIRAMKLLKGRYPDISLTVAGTFKSGLRRSGYERFVRREIECGGLAGHVHFAGSLSALEQISRLQTCAVAVIPSLVESYSMSLAEAMAVGCPCVVSYAGAMPEVAIPERDALFFPIADCEMCAYQIDRLFQSPELSAKLGGQAEKNSRAKHDPALAVDRQLEIYDSIIRDFRKC